MLMLCASATELWTLFACTLGLLYKEGNRVLKSSLYFQAIMLYLILQGLAPLKEVYALFYADSKTLKEEKREELFENLKADESIGWAVDVIDPRELSAKMLKKIKINLNEISHDSAIGLVSRVLNIGVLLTEVFQIYVDTVGDPEKYRIKLSERFPAIKFVVAKKADSLYPVVSGASIVAKVTRDQALRDWVLDETAENMHRNFGSGYPGDLTAAESITQFYCMENGSCPLHNCFAGEWKLSITQLFCRENGNSDPFRTVTDMTRLEITTNSLAPCCLTTINTYPKLTIS
ncbi:unnamed protein product [Ilex paraguariensis]|uniref:Ribonuclease n=1 Tax=Ilex paraguariensis TaxID=185542 RepID=A0ABC8TJM8_9AQUA